MTTKKNLSAHSHTTDSTTEAAASGSVVFIKPPPPLTTIPDVPAGNQNANARDFIGALPKNLELAAMPDVVEELGRFVDYTGIFGKTAPPLEYVLQTALAASQWSAMRAKSATWDEYARTQEGAAWSDFRTIMTALRSALALAVTADATIARQYPALVRLFGAKSVIAQRGVTTRVANKAAKAKGKPPARGKLATTARRLKSAAATLAAAGEAISLPPDGEGDGKGKGAPPAGSPPPPPPPPTNGTTPA